MREVYS